MSLKSDAPKLGDTFAVPMTLDELIEYLRPRFAQIASLELAKVRDRIAALEQEAHRDEG